MTPEQQQLTHRLELALYDSGQQPMINERHRDDIKELQRLVRGLERRLRAIEGEELKRFTKVQAEELFKHLFLADIKERRALAKWVKVAIVPFGFLAVAALLEIIKGIFKW